MRYAVIEQLRLPYPLKELCAPLDLSEGGYYSWRCRPLPQRRQDYDRLEVIIRAAHKRIRETCGPGQSCCAGRMPAYG